MFLFGLIKWLLVGFRWIAEIMGWKRLAVWIGKFVKEEPDFSPEKHVL